MHEAAFDLARLLRPTDPEAFFRDHWEKQPLALSRADPDYYRSLFALRDLDGVLAFTRPRFLDPGAFTPGGTPPAFVQGVLAEEELPPATSFPDLAAVHNAFRRGKTLILGAMHCRWAPIAELCRGLEGVFHCPVHANLYLTPPGAKGFDAHYDSHEVFILHIEGTKHWRLYGPARELPLAEEHAAFAPDELGPPTAELLVRPGDLLYLPRGHVHEAFTSDSLSLHLTVGVKVFRWVDLLQSALKETAARDVRLRASLPPGWLAEGSLAGPLRELLQEVARSARPDQAVERLASAFVAGLSPLPGNYFAAADGADLGPDTLLRRVPGPCRVEVGSNGRVCLHFPGGKLEGPAKIAPALHFIARTPEFAARSLPDLSDDAKLLLARRLLRDGLLVIA